MSKKIESSESGDIDKVIHKFVKKDRVSTYLEKLLSQTHTNFGSIDGLSFDQDDYIELMYILEESGKMTEKRHINLAVNEVLEQIESIKGQLFFLERILLESLGVSGTIPDDDDLPELENTPILDESLLNITQESESSENVDIEKTD